jgi:hypothetical protein
MDKITPSPGDSVVWKWLSGIAEGQVLEVCYIRTEIESSGKRIVRNGSQDNPALIIQHKNGNQVLKLVSEIL